MKRCVDCDGQVMPGTKASRCDCCLYIDAKIRGDPDEADEILRLVRVERDGEIVEPNRESDE